MVGQLTRLLPPNTDEVHSRMGMGKKKKKDDELWSAMFVYNCPLATWLIHDAARRRCHYARV